AQREFQSSEAGRKMLIQVISKFTGLHIDHYAEVNLIAFYQISNAVGGVPVCLLSAVKDPFSGADFKAGYQEIKGTAALSFVRQRHGLPGGDLDRVKRQQAFLAGAIKKVESSPTTIPGLVTAASKSLVMDTKLDLMSLAQQMEKLTSGNVTFTTIPTHGAAQGVGTDALADDPAEVRAFFAKLDGPSGTTSSGKTTAPATTAATQKTTVDVESGAMHTGLGKSVAAALTKAGFTVTTPTDLPGKSDSNQVLTTQIHYAASTQTAAKRVQKTLGYGVLKADSAIGAGHVLVIAGKDAVGQGLRAPTPALVVAPTTATPDTINGVLCVN
ncbi:MAG: LCP family protein, partial [Nakamurella sp.]